MRYSNGFVNGLTWVVPGAAWLKSVHYVGLNIYLKT